MRNCKDCQHSSCQRIGCDIPGGCPWYTSGKKKYWLITRTKIITEKFRIEAENEDDANAIYDQLANAGFEHFDRIYYSVECTNLKVEEIDNDQLQ